MKKVFVIFYCILFVFMCSGCMNKKEPKDLAIINSLIYDKREDGTYQVIIEFMNLSSSSSDEGKKYSTQTAQGKTFREALSNASSTIEKAIYGGHTLVRFFSESAAKEDMAATLDFLLRDHLTDETPLMVVIKGSNPNKIYKASLGLSDSVGVYIDNMQISQQRETSKSVFITTLEFAKDFFDDGKQPVAGIVELIQSDSIKSEANGSQDTGDSQENEDILKCEGLAAFNNDKLVGYFNGIEARSYNFITENIQMAIISIPFMDGFMVCEVTNASTDIKSQIVDKQASFDVKIKTQIRIIADGTLVNINEPKTMKEVQATFNESLLCEIVSAIKKAQTEFKSDIFGFGNSVHIQHPNQWKKIKEEWNEIFANATVCVTVESSIYQTGEIKDSVLSEFTED